MTVRKRGRPARRQWTWKTAVDVWVEYLSRHRGMARRTWRGARSALESFVSLAGQHGADRPGLCRLAHVDAWTAQIAQRGLARSTLSKLLSNLRRFLAFLFGEGQLSQDLAAHVEGPRMYREAAVPPHFSWQEVEAIVAAVDLTAGEGLRDHAMILLLATTGARASEIARVTLDDVDCHVGNVVFRCRKNVEGLLLPLLPGAVKAVRRYLERGRPANSTYRELFLSTDGTPLKRDTLLRALRKAMRRANLAGARGVHAVRHAVGTRLYEQGVGPAQIALILGHRRISTTRVYLRLSIELLREVADNYAELL